MNKPLHVVFVSARFTPTFCGVGDYTRFLGRELIKSGLRVTVLTREQRCPPNVDGVEVRQPVRHWNGFYLHRFHDELLRLRPDIVHLQYEPFGYRQSYGFPAYFSMTKIAPVIATVHEVWHANSLQRRRDKFLYAHMKHIVVNDEGCLKRLTAVEPTVANRVTLLGVGPNIPKPSAEILTQKAEGRSEKIRPPLEIGYFGFFNRTKRIEILLEAFSLFLKKNPGAKLVLLGHFDLKSDSYHRELKNLADRVAPGAADFTGALDDQQISDRLALCDFAVLPFTDGASPRRGSFQACASLGLPVVTTRPLTNENSIVDGTHAHFVHPLTPQALAEGIEKLAHDPELRMRLRQGVLKFAENYTWTRLARAHLDLYSSLIPGR